MNDDEMGRLEASIAEMTEIAMGHGLDFYPMRFEVCPADVLYTFGAYGMPTRFSHWSFGKANSPALAKDDARHRNMGPSLRTDTAPCLPL